MIKHFLVAGVLLLLLLLAAPSVDAQSSLDYTRPATFGSVSLRAGFLPDPHEVRITSGGSVDVDNFLTGSDCRGWAAVAPDYELRWSGNSSYLRFDFASSGDTVLVINDPTGDWYCDDDDGPGLDPRIAFSNPETGVYDIWIASFSRGDFISGTLGISERRVSGTTSSGSSTSGSSTSGSSTSGSSTGGSSSTRLDFTLRPNYGSTSLRAGFLPDPHQVNITSGGPIDVDSLFSANECRGWATSAPDFELTWSGNSSYLRFDFDGAGDTIMIINDPTGDWYCDDDDGPGLDPRLAFSNPETGVYDIWIASFSRGDFISGTLAISERRVSGSTSSGSSTSGSSTSGSSTSGSSTGGSGSTRLDFTLRANYGTTSLRAGFLPDPHQVNITSGGPIDVDSLFSASECRGWATSAPDFELTWSGNASYLRFDFDGAGDTVMIINDPSGDWYCDDDDGPGTDPRLAFSNPETGVYDIWIASFSRGSFHAGTLNISEFRP